MMPNANSRVLTPKITQKSISTAAPFALMNAEHFFYDAKRPDLDYFERHSHLPLLAFVSWQNGSIFSLDALLFEEV